MTKTRNAIVHQFTNKVSAPEDPILLTNQCEESRNTNMLKVPVGIEKNQPSYRIIFG